jgi:DNA-binding transcriptional LysR family regulator
MEIWQLKTFRVVAETLNFTKASEKLNLTQSAVSHHIKALEEELGEPLFIRAKRGVILTPAGKIALEYTVRILDETEEMRERIAGRERALVGRVRVAAATQALVYLFAPIFENFMSDYEGIDLVFRTTANTEQTVTDILHGSADVGFASLPVYSPALKVSELFQDELVLVVGKKHRLAKQKTATLEEISKEKLILLERGASIRRATDAFFKSVNANPELALESNDTYFIKLMVERGVGISLLPSWVISEDVEKKRLSMLKIEGHELKRSVAMVSLAQFQPAPTRKFLSYVWSKRGELEKMAIVAD